MHPTGAFLDFFNLLLAELGHKGRSLFANDDDGRRGGTIDLEGKGRQEVELFRLVGEVGDEG
jgi:hypothetical protein